MRPPRISGRIAVPTIVMILAAVLRLWGLASPNQPYWDEQHYIYDANAYLGGGYGLVVGNPPPMRIASEGTWIHPPLGKWMIALLGIGPLGLKPFGWRIPAALFGITGVGLLYLLALELWGSVWWAGLASFLLALDGLHIVQSRLAMLDIFMTTFVTAGILVLVADRRRMGAAVPQGRARRLDHRLFGSPYRFWAGFMLGAAAASKWAGLFALALAALLSSTWVLMGAERSRRSRLSSIGTIVASFVAVPILVYLVSYGAFFYQHGLAIHDFLILQLRMLQYHQHHTQIQPQNSLPWTWPLLLHPIRYFGASAGASLQRIVAVGNPALWWGFLLLVPVAMVTTIRKPEWQDVVVFGGYVAMYVPWLYIGRSQFLFYMLPAVPFMCLGVVATLRKLPARLGRDLGIAFAALVAAAALAYIPIWIGAWVGRSWVSRLRLLPRWPV
jgi:dolichyl-phosphate-mannose--protein O-mannosyl transferase